MSRFFIGIIVFASLWIGVLSSSAATFGDFDYEVLENNSVEITGYHGSGEELVIPDKIGGMPVTSIGDSAFYRCWSLTSVTIPDSVTSIGDSAFYNCYGLTSVTIPDSVMSIGAGAFSFCYSLTAINASELNSSFSSVDGVLYDKNQTTLIQCPGGYEGHLEIPARLTSIGGGAFYDCWSLTSVTIPDSVTSIGDSAFSGCQSMTSVTIGNSVTSIGDRAFDGCYGLTSVTIPESVTNIGGSAFYRCYGLTSVTIGNSVTSIGTGAFSACAGLTAINVSELNPSFCSVDGVLYDKNQTIVIQCPGKYKGHFEIPPTVSIIEDYAFCGCIRLTSVTMPDSVTSIGNWAFACGSEFSWFPIVNSDLEIVKIGTSVVTIGNGAFKWCRSLTSVTIPDSVTSIGDGAFSQCQSLTTATFGESVSSIGNYAFEGCHGLTIVTIPDSLTSIGNAPFNLCTGLTAINVSELNSSFSSVGGVLYDKNQTTVIQCPGRYVGYFEIPETVTSISDWAFANCDGLTSVGIGDSLASIGNNAFAACGNLIDIFFKGNAPSADDSVFDGSEPTIYYIERTEGWGATFAGRPTAVWFFDELFLEQMTFDSKGVHFSVVGPAGRTVLVQACTGLATGEWQDLGTYSLDESGAFAFTDPAWADYPSRFYRAALTEGSGPIPDSMALIPAGFFLMGDSFGGEFTEDELPRHSVYESGFFMDRFEVTKQLWDEVRAWGNDHGYDLVAGGGKGPDHPVLSVSWYDVVKWCNARSEKEGLTPCYYTSDTRGTVYRTGAIDLSNDSVRWDANGYRLPTEAEWEKAARGGLTGKRFPWGHTISHIQANYYSSSGYSNDVSPTEGYHPDYDSGYYPYTSPVGSFSPNGYGLYDMAGNVWEWCWDWWDEGWYGQSGANEPNPVGPEGGSFRVFRGGGWDDYPIRVRCAYRSRSTPDSRGYHVGFRCARGQF